MTNRILRAAAAPVAALALFAGIGASTAAAAPAPPHRPMVGPPLPAAPAPSQLQSDLQAALNGDGSKLESGNAANIAVVKTRVAGIPGYTWDVTGPVTVRKEDKTNIDVATATLNSRLGGYVYSPPLTWKLIGGTWKLSKQSEDNVVGMANLKF